MRPRIGKGKWWDKVTPTEQKEIDKVAKKYAVGEILEYEHRFDSFHPIEVKRYVIVEEGAYYYGNIKLLITKLNHHDAVMWAKMME